MRRIHAESAERGERWFLADVAGNVIRTWDDQGRIFRVSHDDLHRPVTSFVTVGKAAETALSHTVYGELHPNAVALNMRGAACRHYDSAARCALVDSISRATRWA